jgi:hypothetical protein
MSDGPGDTPWNIIILLPIILLLAWLGHRAHTMP